MPDSGNAKEDFISLLAEDLGTVTSSLGERTLAQIVGVATSNPRFKEAYWESAIAPRRRAIAQVLERAKGRGELREAAHVEFAIDLMVGPLLCQLLIKPTPVPLDDLLRRVVEAIWQTITVYGQ